jgi:dolichol-phosphate mannosyltransferase
MVGAASSSAPGGEARPLPSVTVVVPTYREAHNIRHLLERIEAVRADGDLELDVLLMDDDSADGTEQAVRDFGRPWVELVVRSGTRDLSRAVVEGLQRARGEAVLIMDADLSHPPESIPELLAALATGHRAALGSRYVAGGTTDDDWGLTRNLVSRVATLLAKPLTAVHDPMAGFFAMWRRDLDGVELRPLGYKIVLELIVKCSLHDIAEVPIHFRDRRRGESKLTAKQQLLYLAHLRRLYAHRLRSFTRR